ncbi:MAG: PTS sugar transporter subunit IIB [Erysipelotrichaceae bacterium]|nr:PTS sugar transporter subunit IIB [Erysipelotrichaceae bacterium]
MKRFYLFCNAGMSTSLLANRMQKVAGDHNLPIEVKAFPDSEMDTIVNEYHPDVILLGPQVKYLLDKVVTKYGHTNTPIFVIDPRDYGEVNGERVLKAALKALKERKD